MGYFYNYVLIFNFLYVSNNPRSSIITSLKSSKYIKIELYNSNITIDGNDLKVLKKWILTAKTYLKPTEWIELFKECGYTGYYDFTILKTNKWLKS